MGRTPSIKDVARVAGVSYSTVSRALGDSPRVNADTKVRIQQIAADMGYLPSAVARSLVTQRTHTLGVVVTTATDLFFAEMIRALEETARERGFSVILSNSRGDAQGELYAVRTLRERRVDGIILVSGCSDPEDLGPETTRGVPMVVINRAHPRPESLSVQVDNVGGARQATQHLLELGHRRIAHIAGPPAAFDSVERRRGYEEAMAAMKVAPDPALAVEGSSRPQGGIEAAEKLLDLPEQPTAIFCYNDATAIGAMRAIRAAGLRVPQDVSVIGFDDINLAPFFEPPLTTVAQPIPDLCETAVDMVLGLLSGRKDIEDRVLPGRLVVRETTAPWTAIVW